MTVQSAGRLRTPILSKFHLTQFDATVLSICAALAIIIGASAIIGRVSEPGLRVAYLKLDEKRLFNVFVAETDSPENAKQVTHTEYGVFDYDVSADGRYIAYTERNFETGSGDLYLLDLQNGDVQRLTTCAMQDSDCVTPAFRPDGNAIAYERSEFNSALGLGTSAKRIWMLDLTTDPISTFPIFQDTQILGYSPTWSPDGTRIAFYNTADGGVMVYNFTAPDTDDDPALKFVPTNFGTVGSLSPDGSRLVFPEMFIDGSETRGFLQVADLTSGFYQILTEREEPLDDQLVAWSPDGRFIAIGRRYRDERFTRGAQIFLLDVDAGTIEPAIYDARYANGNFEWSPDSDALVMQRLPLLDENGDSNPSATVEIWIYELESGKLTRIDADARLPMWVP
jgi:Tol biopolymer transport system component